MLLFKSNKYQKKVATPQNVEPLLLTNELFFDGYYLLRRLKRLEAFDFYWCAVSLF